MATEPGLISEQRKIAHLLRRAGFGATAAELDEYTRLGYQKTLERLLDFEKVDDSALEARVAAIQYDPTRLADVAVVWLTRMRHTRRPLVEKMTLFWHGHLTSGNVKVQNPLLMLVQNNLFRQHALGSYRELLVAISRDGAMLKYLDGTTSHKRRPNENYAREFFELFTLGRGHYTETDVREAARAFTGWHLDKEGSVSFNPKNHDAGTKTVLGVTGKLDAAGVVDAVLAQPQAARWLARRLFRFFVHENPPAPAVERLATAFRASGYDLRALLRALFTLPDFLAAETYHAQIKSPVELVVGALKALNVETVIPGHFAVARRLGQELFNPPNVKGWDGGRAWLSTSTVVERMNAANALAVARKVVDPTPLLMRRQPGNVGDLVNGLAEDLVDGDILPAHRGALAAYAGGPGAGLSPRMLDTKGRGLVALVMGSPAYQLN